MAVELHGNGQTALGHLRVLDLTGPSAHHFGKVMADLGADVIKVEPPEGDPGRKLAPFAAGQSHPEGSLHFAHYNTGKRSFTADVTSSGGRRALRGLVPTADVLVESFASGYMDEIGLGYKSLSRLNPGLVVTSITPFGQTGPHRHHLGSELVAQATGGLMYVQGDDKAAPCMAPCDQAYQLASFHGVYATLAALNGRRATGRGQHVDVSAQESAANLMFTLARYAATSVIVRRTGAVSQFAPNNYYQCKDGWVCLGVFTGPHWDAFVKWLGDEALTTPEWRDRMYRREHAGMIDDLVVEFAAGFTVSEFVEQGQSWHLCVSALNTIGEVAASSQVEARDFFVPLDHPHLGQARYVGPPFRMSATPATSTSGAPLLGGDDSRIAAELDDRPRRASASAGRARGRRERPLSGVRVLDFTRVWAGPMSSRYLGDLGAEVIKIESGRFLDMGRTNMTPETNMAELHRSKLAVTLNFQDPRGRELAEHLVEVSDIVMDNFAAGVLERRGLGYEALRRIRPDIIAVSMPGYGASGPYANYISYGQNLMAYSGLSHLWGHAGSHNETHSKLHYPDFVGAAAATAGILGALEHRAETGRGQYIEVAQLESLLATQGVALLDYFVNGAEWQPAGNRSPNAAPHGVYPCLGDDQWCAIECWDEEQWAGLRGVMGDPEWAENPRFADLAARLQNQDALDELIGEWTREQTPYQVTRKLQARGVPAGIVQSGEQLFYDRHLRDRDYILDPDEPANQGFGFTAPPFKLSGSPGGFPRGGSEVGEHNGYVYSEVLGVDPEHVGLLESEGAIA